jgi:hypothetical protein
MADDLTDAPWVSESLPDAPWVAPATPQDQPSALAKAAEPITSYPETYSKMNREAQEQVGRGVGQLSNPESGWDVAKGAGNVALGSLGYAMSPISAGLRTVVGKPVEENTGIPKEYSEFAASLALPGLGLTRVPGAAAIPKIPPRGPLGVTLSEGQATGDLPLIQREQAALRGQSGTPAQARAQEFANQQATQLGAAKEDISRGFDQFGNVIAETPQEGAEIASKGFRSAATSAKAGVTTAYKTARELPGEINSSAFTDIVPTIQKTLSDLPQPVIVNELTPWASKAVDFLKDKVSNLQLTNKVAYPTGVVPAGEEVSTGGVNLNGIDQWRKQLSAMRRNSFNPQDMSDYRATSAILDAFDTHIDQAVNSGMFRGDPRAVSAWNDARAAFSDYKSTFGKQPNDPVGRVVQKVLGDKVNDAASANAVADHLFGSSGTNPSDLNRGVAQRFKTVLGETSPEWAAVKQGLFSRLTEPGADLAEWGPKKTSDKINRFLNIDGKEMASVVYSPEERQAIQSYADLLRKLEVPQAGANWSNTGTAKIFQKIGSNVGMVVGAVIGSGAGHAIGMPPLVGEAAGAALAKGSQALANAREARIISQQMPLLSTQMQNWGKAYIRSQAAPTPAGQKMLAGATVTLDSTLRKFGISFSDITHGTVPAAAEPEQNKRFGGRTNKPNQNANGKSHNPPMPGARRAPDGKYYLPDKARPGKFLRIDA